MKSITLQSSDSVISSSGVLGRLGFAASSESDGSDSILVAAMVKAVAEGDFTQTSNATSLVFSTALSSTASDKLKITSEGHFVPFASGQYDLGSPNYHFRNIYADNIIGDYSGQLDGNLDLNGYDIVGTGNITIDGNVTAEYFYGDLDGVVVTECRNDTGSTIAEGTPVYVAGYYSSNGKPLVAPADCANAAKMPAIGLLASELTTGSEGHVHVFGLAQNLPSGVTNGFSVGETVYVAAGGGLTNVRPTGVSELVQNMGRVLKTGTNGRILVLGPGRSNDVPNSGHFEQLTVDGYTALAVDGGNVGIGTPSPSVKLDVNGAIKTSSYIQFATTNGYIGGQTADTLTYQADSHRFWNEAKTAEYATFNTSSVVFNDGGLNRDFRVEGYNDEYLFLCDADTDRVGIGTDSPSEKLHITDSTDEAVRFLVENASGVQAKMQAFSSGGSNGQVYIGAVSDATLNLIQNNVARMTFNNSTNKQITINPLNEDADLQVRGVTDNNVLRVDAANDRLGVGIFNPSYKLHVKDGSSEGFFTGGIWYADHITGNGDSGFVIRTSGINVWSIQNDESEGDTFHIRNGGFGGDSRLKMDSSRTTFNEGNLNIDLRVKGENDDNVLYVDANNDKVGIGTASPSSKLDVSGIITATSGNSTQWNTAYGWGDHGTQGYLIPSFTPPINLNQVLSYNGSNWINKTFDISLIEKGSIPFGGYSSSQMGYYYSWNSNSEAVVNDGGATINFRVEGDADQNLLFVKGAGGADKVGVGTSALNGKFNVYQTTENQSYQYGSHVSANHYTTTGGTNYVFGNYTDVRKHVASGVTDTGYVMGHEVISVLSDEGSLGSSLGLRTYAGINSQSDNGNLTFAYGIQSRVINYSQGTGNINTARCIDVYINGDLGSVGNGGITNAYGVYIQSILNSTNTYGLYQVGSSDKNYFAGDVGIGTASPSYKLDVNGTFSANSINVNDQFTFPTTDGSADQILVTDGSGSIAWGDQIVLNQTVNGRLTLESGEPVSTTNQTAKTTLYFTPYKGNQIALYNGTAWGIHSFSELSLSLSGYTANTNYDIFIYDNSGTLTLESAAWTNNTTRATALTTQDGVYVKTGATTRRYLGTIRITGTTGQCEDSSSRRFVWNYYNQTIKQQRAKYVTGHTYTTSSWRAWANVTTVGETRVELVIGIGQDIRYDILSTFRYGYAGVTLDGTAADTTSVVIFNGSIDTFHAFGADNLELVTSGYHFVQAIQYGLTTYGNFNNVVIEVQFLG